MKKTNTTKKKATARKSVARTTAPQKQQCFNPWSFSIYVYWFIILFFIAATFYILGRSHNALRVPSDNVEVIETSAPISEETLKQSADYYASGRDNLVNGDIQSAIVDLNTAVNSNPDDIDAYILRGEAYMQSSDYRNALSDFNTAIEKDPVNAVAYYDRALLNTRLEDYTSAMNDINNALAAQSARPSDILQMRDLYAKRGQLNLWTKNWEGAIADYTNSLARPDGTVTPNVYAERAEAYTALNNYAAAIADYATAVRIISEQIQGAQTSAERETMSSAAMSYFEKSAALNLNLGNVDSARSDLESAITIAIALNDSDTVTRLQGLMSEMDAE